MASDIGCDRGAQGEICFLQALQLMSVGVRQL